MKTRLDVFLAENNLAKSRTDAKRMIESGGVFVNGKEIKKASFLTDSEDKLELTAEESEFVGRGGYKLKAALDTFGISLDKAVCADLGASTGGFSDCMLKRGANKIYAVDVGQNQLDKSLIDDPRVVNIEKMNVRDITDETFFENMDFVSADLSFISLTFALLPMKSILKSSGQAVALVKPQFEAGKSELNKNGIVKSKKAHIAVLSKIISQSKESGFSVKGLCVSPIKGGDGNIEYLIYLSLLGESEQIDINSVVNSAFNNLK